MSWKGLRSSGLSPGGENQKNSQIWGRRPDEGGVSSGRRWQEGSVRGEVCVVRTKVRCRPDEGNRNIFF